MIAALLVTVLLAYSCSAQQNHTELGRPPSMQQRCSGCASPEDGYKVQATEVTIYDDGTATISFYPAYQWLDGTPRIIPALTFEKYNYTITDDLAFSLFSPNGSVVTCGRLYFEGDAAFLWNNALTNSCPDPGSLPSLFCDSVSETGYNIGVLFKYPEDDEHSHAGKGKGKRAEEGKGGKGKNFRIQKEEVADDAPASTSSMSVIPVGIAVVAVVGLAAVVLAVYSRRRVAQEHMPLLS